MREAAARRTRRRCSSSTIRCAEFSYVHMARKVVGVGSVGTRAWIVLLRGRDDARPAAAAGEAGRGVGARAVPAAERVRQPRRAGRRGQRLMQAASDIFLGWQRAGRGRRGAGHQQPALDGTLVGDADLPVGEVPQPAVHRLERPPRRTEGQVVGVDGDHGQPARGGVQRDAGTGDAEPDDEQVDDPAVGGLASSAPVVRRTGPVTRSRPEVPVHEGPQLAVEGRRVERSAGHRRRGQAEAVGREQHRAGQQGRVAGAYRAVGPALQDAGLEPGEQRVLGAAGRWSR